MRTEQPIDSEVTEILNTQFAKKARRLVQSKHGARLLAFIAFVESMLPVPLLTDPFLMAAVLLDRMRTWRLVLLTTISSVVGGVAAFLMATYFKDFLFSLLSAEAVATINSFAVAEEGVFLLTIIGAITPVPYTLVAWAVALSSGHIFVFIIASLVGRGFRYSIVGWCTYRFGPAAVKYAQRSILLTSIVIFLLAGLYIWLKM